MRTIVYGLAVLATLSVSTMCSGASALTLGAVQDADVATGGGWDNYTPGLEPWISINYSEATSVIAHIEFDVSSITPGTVMNATLRLFHDLNINNGVAFDVYRIISPWSEASVNYPTRPSLNATLYSTLAIADSNVAVWREWDLTSLVQEWVNGASTNYGLAILRNPDEQHWPYFRSKDYSVSQGLPELVVALVPEPTSLATFGMAVASLMTQRRARPRCDKH
jgi:TGF-beta propeptide